jgi:ABC-2 type transport system ATP-binding protein
MTPAPAIAVRNLTKRYSQANSNAVDGVTFEVEQGGIFGLLGPNGAGKTTTIGVLTTAVVPTGGEASIMGFDVVREQVRVKQRIAVVPQRPNLDRSLLVREILTFHAAYHGVPRREREAHADQLLKELGLYERRNEKADRYSGGMSQRLMIARALMHQPDVLFLDEPTNNLDPQSRLFLWERIRALNQQGLTILLTTHDMDEADRLCQRIAIMDLGRILVNDTPAELKKLIPGGNSLELHVETGEPAGLTERFGALPGVTKVEEVPNAGADGEPGVTSFHVFAAEAGSLVGAAAQAILESGARVRDISVRQATLEEVFIYLTGKHLR